jgi:hypothetical protein
MADDQILHRDTPREEYFYQQGRLEAFNEAFSSTVTGVRLQQQHAVVRNAKEQIA